MFVCFLFFLFLGALNISPRLGELPVHLRIKFAFLKNCVLAELNGHLYMYVPVTKST